MADSYSPLSRPELGRVLREIAGENGGQIGLEQLIQYLYTLGENIEYLEGRPAGLVPGMGSGGAGHEELWTVTATVAAIPISMRPSNAWTYGNPGVADGLTWYVDPPGVSILFPYLWRVSRAVSGTPAAGDDVAAVWSLPRIRGAFIVGEDGRGIAGIVQVGTTITITYTDNSTDDFALGEGVSISSVVTEADGDIVITFSDGTTVEIPAAQAGRGIESINRVGDVVTVAYDDGSDADTFMVRDGLDGRGIASIVQVGSMITVTYTDNSTDDFALGEGVSISSVVTEADGDIVITFSDGTTVEIPAAQAGRGIESINRVGDVVTVAYDDGSDADTFMVRDGLDGRGIASIVQVGSMITVTYTDNSTDDFALGEGVSISSVVTEADGDIVITFSDGTTVEIPAAQAGRGIESINRVGDVVTVAYDDGSDADTFMVRDGLDGRGIASIVQVGSMITVTYTDNSTDDFALGEGVSISSVVTEADGDIVITFSDGTTVEIPAAQAGRGIESINRVGDVVTVAYDDGSDADTFMVRDGLDGRGIASIVQVGSMITVTYTDNSTDDFALGEGVSISSVVTEADGDIVITFSDGTTVEIPAAQAGRGIESINRVGDVVTVAYDDGSDADTFEVSDGDAGADGNNPPEVIYAATSSENVPASMLPRNTWDYDSFPQAANGLIWNTEAPGLTSVNRYLHRAQRTIVGQPAAGDEIAGQWSSPRVVGRFGLDGDAGEPGLPGRDAGLYFPWVYGLLYNNRNENSAVSSTGGAWLLATDAGNVGAQADIPWADITDITFSQRDADGIDRSLFFNSDDLATGRLIIAIRHENSDGTADVVAFEQNGEVVDNADNTFSFPVTRSAAAQNFDQGTINDIDPPLDADYSVRLLLPDIERVSNFPRGRVLGIFLAEISATIATALDGIADDEAWPTSAVNAANAATPGPNVPGDMVILFRGGESWSRAWDGDSWEIPAAFIDGLLVVSGTIAARHIAAQAITADKILIGPYMEANADNELTLGDIQSSNFEAGSVGWRARQNGQAEFDAAFIRGVLSAESIEPAVVSIRVMWLGTELLGTEDNGNQFTVDDSIVDQDWSDNTAGLLIVSGFVTGFSGQGQQMVALVPINNLASYASIGDDDSAPQTSFVYLEGYVNNANNKLDISRKDDDREITIRASQTGLTIQGIYWVTGFRGALAVPSLNSVAPDGPTAVTFDYIHEGGGSYFFGIFWTGSVNDGGTSILRYEIQIRHLVTIGQSELTDWLDLISVAPSIEQYGNFARTLTYPRSMRIRAVNLVGASAWVEAVRDDDIYM